MYDIKLLIVIDGLMPKHVSGAQENVLNKSIKMWEQLRLSTENKEAQADGRTGELFLKLLETYGSRCFLTELVNAALETNTEYLIAPYYSTP